MGVSKYDNAFKQKVLVNKIDVKVASVMRDTYKKSTIHYIADFNGEISSYFTTNLFRDMAHPYKQGYNLIDCAIRLIESKYRKAKKVRDKIGEIVLSDKAVFVTLTFRDSVFDTTTTETRRRYVARYLKRYARKYVANIDFGDDDRYTHREHYHALIDSEIDFTEWLDKFGFIFAERVHKQSKKNNDKTLQDDLIATSKYITKLTNHALKVKGVVPRLIYSRDTL